LFNVQHPFQSMVEARDLADRKAHRHGTHRKDPGSFITRVQPTEPSAKSLLELARRSSVFQADMGLLCFVLLAVVAWGTPIKPPAKYKQQIGLQADEGHPDKHQIFSHGPETDAPPSPCTLFPITEASTL